MPVSFSQLGKVGRIGNQLFQCAATISLALRNNDKYIFPFWEYENDFNLYDCFSNDIKFDFQYKEPNFHYNEIPYQENMDIAGFFQSYKYFEDYKDIILNKLTPREGYGILYNTTSLHIRRTDYSNNPAYEQLDMDYYNKAMDMIKSKYYYIFSDDINWCKRHFTGNNITFIEGNSAVTDLSLQSSCEHNIIANSSFSWWGAFLNKNPSKIVICPKKWFGSALNHDIKDLLMPEWIRI